jgi:hypothetical protein
VLISALLPAPKRLIGFDFCSYPLFAEIARPLRSMSSFADLSVLSDPIVFVLFIAGRSLRPAAVRLSRRQQESRMAIS